MDRERITHELKYYRSYKAAIETTLRMQESHAVEDRYMSASPCRVTLYSDMPSVFGGGSRRPALTGGMSFDDALELKMYSELVTMLEIAMGTLTEPERELIEFKWMDDLTLNQIADRKGFSPRTAKTIHSRALEKMYRSLRFYYLPELEVPLPLPVA